MKATLKFPESSLHILIAWSFYTTASYLLIQSLLRKKINTKELFFLKCVLLQVCTLAVEDHLSFLLLLQRVRLLVALSVIF